MTSFRSESDAAAAGAGGVGIPAEAIDQAERDLRMFLGRIESMAKRSATALVVLALLSSCGTGTVPDSAPRSPSTPSASEQTRVGDAGVTLVLPLGWHFDGKPGTPGVTDPLARIVVGSEPVQQHESQCQVADFAPSPTGIAIVVLEWEQTDGRPGARPETFDSRVLPLRTGSIECFDGLGGVVAFTENDRVLGVYVLAGDRTTGAGLQRAREALATLRVTKRPRP
jgi:hypothetical protein